MLGDKGKPLCTWDKGTRTNGRGPKPRSLTDIHTGNKDTRTNERIRMHRPKPHILTHTQIGTGKLTYRQIGEKGTRTNKLIRARTRQKYVLAAQYIMVSSYSMYFSRTSYY